MDSNKLNDSDVVKIYRNVAISVSLVTAIAAIYGLWTGGDNNGILLLYGVGSSINAFSTYKYTKQKRYILAAAIMAGVAILSLLDMIGY